MTPSELVPIEVLAKKLHVSIGTIRVWVREGVIPPDKYMLVHRTYRFDAEGIIKHMLNDEGEQNVE